jgi:hypothetical protein
MAVIEIRPLSDRFADDEIAELARQMEKSGAPSLPRSDESQVATVADDVDDDALTEFLDRLDAHDISADVYLPVEFEGVFEVADLRVASLQSLMDVLDEVKDEIDVDEDEDDEEEEEEQDDEHDPSAELREVWHYVYDGAVAALDRKLPLHIKS